jgi:hypothetical protein
LDRVRRRQPGAQSAERIFAISGKIVDAAVLVHAQQETYQALVLYPKTKPPAGTAPFDGADSMDVTVDDISPNADLSVLRAMWAYAVHYQCDGAPAPNQRFYNGPADVYVKIRDIFQQTTTIRISNGGYNSLIDIRPDPMGNLGTGTALAFSVTGEDTWSYPFRIRKCGETPRNYIDLRRKPLGNFHSP